MELPWPSTGNGGGASRKQFEKLSNLVGIALLSLAQLR
jgi:hypothetical protein